MPDVHGDYPPFTVEQVEEIRRMCTSTWRVLDELKGEAGGPHYDALTERMRTVESIQEALR